MDRSESLIYEFGPYLLDIGESVLMLAGRPVALRPKAFQTLRVLIQSNGRVVEKEQLLSQVWPDTCVEESNLSQNIFILRRVLGERADAPKYIETVPRRGYRFVAPVKTISRNVLSQTLVLGDQAGGETEEFPLRQTARILAVLPFTNITSDQELEYLSDGITEGIINSVSQLPRLRVMSRSAVFRYKGKQLDAQEAGRELGVDAVLVGQVSERDDRLLISTELVEVSNGWQLWGDSYDCELGSIFEVQDEIAKRISTALRLRLTGEDEQRLAKRYTESAEAYHEYLKGRYFWSKFSREGLERAILHFRRGIELDPNYALAYASIVDCYLRLATNYLLPADLPPGSASSRSPGSEKVPTETDVLKRLVERRHEWDRTSAERELKRAVDLKSNYPAVHQWYVVYLFAVRFYEASVANQRDAGPAPLAISDENSAFQKKVAALIDYVSPSPDEQVQVFCTVAREQMYCGNYEAACAALQPWWIIGEWPKLEDLSPYTSADLLLTAGALAGWTTSTRQVPKGHKNAEALLSGSIGVFEHLGLKSRSAEARIELAYCYYREGLFEVARSTLVDVLKTLPEDNHELRSVALIRLAIVERHAGRPKESLNLLNDAAKIVKLVGPWATARYHHELVTTLKDLGIAEMQSGYFEQALEHYEHALYEYEAIGNHRYAAALQNNHGHLLLTIKRFDDAWIQLKRARKLFDGLGDKVRRAQVDETLARLHLGALKFDLAEQAIVRAIRTLGSGGEEALLAEALTTHGAILCRVRRVGEAKRVLDRASQVAERCGDVEGAKRALSIILQELSDQLDDGERLETQQRLKELSRQS